jgi:cob(I)alamin adenosyltransferase
MSIYTRRGDEGVSDLQAGRVAKQDARFEVLGDVDELSAALGIANSAADPFWLDIQSQLLDLGSALSGYECAAFAHRVEALEAKIDALTAALPPLKNFVLPIGKAPSRWHLARAVCRRAERHFWATAPADPLPGQYLNRLSDLIFQQARAVAHGDVRYQQRKGLF